MAVTSGSGDDREPEPPNIPALLEKSNELLALAEKVGGPQWTPALHTEWLNASLAFPLYLNAFRQVVQERDALAEQLKQERILTEAALSDMVCSEERAELLEAAPAQTVLVCLCGCPENEHERGDFSVS